LALQNSDEIPPNGGLKRRRCTEIGTFTELFARATSVWSTTWTTVCWSR